MNFDEFKQKFQKIEVVEHTNQVPKTPYVSVCIMTYQHSKFIRQCLDGVLMQKTNFSFEILLGEDESTDDTREICITYAHKYPNKIRLLLHHRQNNIQIGGLATGRFNLLYCLYSTNGKHIALCEGDDYWTDPYKLQKQVDFLEANPDFSICFHKVQILENNEFKDDYITNVPATVTTVHDLINGNYIHTPSCVFRNRINQIIGKHFQYVSIADYYIHIMNALYGKVYYIDELMAVYRVHPNSFWSSRSDVEKSVPSLISYMCIYKDILEITQDEKLIHYLKRKLLFYSSDLIPKISTYLSSEEKSLSNTEINLLLSMYSEMCEELGDLYDQKEFASYYLREALLNLKEMFKILFNKFYQGYFLKKFSNFVGMIFRQ